MSIIKKFINYGQTKEQLRYGMLVYYMAILGASLGLITGTIINPDNEAGFVLYIFMFMALTVMSLSLIVTHLLLRGDKADDVSDTAEPISC